MSADEWAKWVRANAKNLHMGTTAQHMLGDISRDNPDIFLAREEVGDQLVGEWLDGFGFVNVTFPKATSRRLTVVELDWLIAHPVVLS